MSFLLQLGFIVQTQACLQVRSLTKEKKVLWHWRQIYVYLRRLEKEQNVEKDYLGNKKGTYVFILNLEKWLM